MVKTFYLENERERERGVHSHTIHIKMHCIVQANTNAENSIVQPEYSCAFLNFHFIVTKIT